jgi:hypothetical protein
VAVEDAQGAMLPLVAVEDAQGAILPLVAPTAQLEAVPVIEVLEDEQALGQAAPDGAPILELNEWRVAAMKLSKDKTRRRSWGSSLACRATWALA